MRRPNDCRIVFTAQLFVLGTYLKERDGGNVDFIDLGDGVEPLVVNSSTKDQRINRVCTVVTANDDIVIIGGYSEIDGESKRTVEKLDTVTK